MSVAVHCIWGGDALISVFNLRSKSFEHVDKDEIRVINMY